MRSNALRRSLSRQSSGIDESQMSHFSHEGEPAGNAKRKRKRHRRSNLILAALCLVAAGLVLTTFFLLRSREMIEFETAFAIFAKETAVVAEMHAENVFGQLQSLAASVVLGGTESGQLPVVSIPNFDRRMQKIANLTGIELLMFVPIVPNERQEEWEADQLNSHQWIQEGYEYRGWNTSNLEPIPKQIHSYPLPEDYNDTRRGYVDTGFMEAILANHTAVNKTGCAVPVAQIGPRLIDTSVVMTDLFTHPVFKKEIVASLEYDVPVISEVEDIEYLLKHARPVMSDEFDYSLPRSFTLDQVKSESNGESITIGFVVGIIQWNAFFRNFLPLDVNGIIVKIESDCGRSFTYVVNGGRDDEWYLDSNEDPRSEYEYLEQRFKFFWKDHPKGTSRHCHFDLLISPANDFADKYLTKTPIMWAGVVLAAFVLAVLAFLVYDRYNQKQREKIANEKAQAEAVVTSLFPRHVGQQLMEEQGQASLGRLSQDSLEDGALSLGTLSRGLSTLSLSQINLTPLAKSLSLPYFCGSNPMADDSEWQDEEQEQERAVPLAELYPSASIMFADLKGFTAWSSNRPPCDVFTLLETIYHEMDELAKKCKVFKIETIGDCYVSVCGLPRKRNNHAVMMAWFAQQCLDKFKTLVIFLEGNLPGTASLELRTGLHAGPVTAGVLRGERARFQLFGDTVNTTARIESAGEGSRIHVSQEFANELARFDKGHWVVPREDKVEAKGKGTLTTFWLDVRAAQEKRPSVSSGYSLGSISEGSETSSNVDDDDGNDNGASIASKVSASFRHGMVGDNGGGDTSETSCSDRADDDVLQVNEAIQETDGADGCGTVEASEGAGCVNGDVSEGVEPETETARPTHKRAEVASTDCDEFSV